jgi:CheY-like chemotaxis protein
MTYRVLLVEDDDDHAYALTRGLKNCGIDCVVDRVKDGEEAINYLLDSNGGRALVRPDIVLLDLKLPKKSGHEVLQEVKSHPDLRVIPVVVLSTSSASVDKMRAYQHHANSYLVKPVDSESSRAMFKTLCQYWSIWNIPARDPISSELH